MLRPREPCAPHLLERGIRALVISDVSLSCLLMSSHMNIRPSETLWLSKRACPRGGVRNLPGTPQGTPRQDRPQRHGQGSLVILPCGALPGDPRQATQVGHSSVSLFETSGTCLTVLWFPKHFGHTNNYGFRNILRLTPRWGPPGCRGSRRPMLPPM